MTDQGSNAPTAEDEVLAAADALVDAFGSHDVERYFASFAPEATFVFHTTPRWLGTRAEYEQEWRSWEREGFKVLSCESHDQSVELLTDDVAVFTHSVRTRLEGVDDVQRERETIVFRRVLGTGWLGVHEHLSPDPTPEDAA
jgi:ketosteroid isomerase-like protein